MKVLPVGLDQVFKFRVGLITTDGMVVQWLPLMPHTSRTKIHVCSRGVSSRYPNFIPISSIAEPSKCAEHAGKCKCCCYC